MYTAEELLEVQDVLIGKRTLSDSEFNILKTEFEHKRPPNHMFSFVKLFAINPDLYNKISTDKNAEKYSLFGFFPETFEMVYHDSVAPTIYLEQGNRGVVGIIKHPTKNVVIKPLQNTREYEIAQIADELKIGPKQYASLEGFLTEQFIEGDLFSRLTENQLSSDNIFLLGIRTGDILTKLHSRNIFYNDTILSDDFGRSHLMVPEKSPAILFDYGVALKLNKHPNCSDEEIFNFARTLPIVSMFLGTEPSEKQVYSLIEQYRPQLNGMTKEQIMSRDIDFINEGLHLASYRLGNYIVDPFSRGFKETYYK